jgi:two-component system sensor histidine kinase/response regulator
MMGEAAQLKGLRLTSLCSPDVPELVTGDAGRLRQILLNLVSNGIKFTEGGRVAVTLSARREGGSGRLRFEVKDTGIGIQPQHLGTVFQPFLQADSSTTRRYGGTGLGLAISAQLVSAMGGEIGVDSTPGKGSTFWFEVPHTSAA